MTVADLIKSSLRVCRVLAKAEVPDANEMQDSLEALQMMLGLWSADNLMVWGSVEETFPLTANKRVYTIGDGGDFDTVYPYKINSASLIDGNNVITGVDILTRTEYEAYADRLLAISRPEALFYDGGLANQATPTGTIYVYPIPDGSTAYTLTIVSVKALADILTSTEDFNLLPPYREAVKYNLALRLWDEYHEEGDAIPAHIVRLAAESRAVIERNSFEMEISPISVPGIKTGTWNILSDISN